MGQQIREAFNDESFVIQYMSYTPQNEIALFPHCHKTMKISKQIFNESLWIDNSKDTNNPPDFYSNTLKLMMDVMQVNEYVYEEARGNKIKHIDPMKQQEGLMLKELLNNGLEINEDTPIVIAAGGDNMIGVEHNYQQYLNDFKRVVGYHNSQIPKYKANHPGFKTILFVLDVSSQYVVTTKKLTKDETKAGKMCAVKDLHHWFLDKNFVDIIKSLDCEYVVWATPWKFGYQVLTGVNEIPKMPQICIYKVSDCKNMKTIEYDEELLISVEDNS